MKKIILLLAAVFILVLAVGLYLYNKPHQNIRKEKAHHWIDAKQLSTFYTTNETKADSTYLGKIIEVHGEVFFGEQSQETGMIVLKGNGVSDIRCKLLETEINHALKYPSGSQLILKGVCIGLLLDVNMSECIIVNK